MKISHLFMGSIMVEITCPSALDLVTKIKKSEITIEDVSFQSDMVIICWIKQYDYDRLLFLVQKLGYEMKVLKRKGIYWLFRGLAQRTVILIGSLLLLLLSFYIPTRVLFVNVQGNQFVSDYQILEAADSCGISFGASRRDVRSERMKNALLDALPQLQWAGVNTYGCVAVITVREREHTDQANTGNRVSEIVATQDGIINQLTVKSGNPLCRVGQAVKKGEKLVSGYTDCGRIVRAERSAGEIFAYTNRKLSVVSPELLVKETTGIKDSYNFYIIIGKKLINLSQDSGISDATCDKIYKKITLTLPGGFELPFSILCVHSTTPETPVGMAKILSLEDTALDYLKSQMVAGQILNYHTAVTRNDELVILNGVYFCNEMIGKEQIEEYYE